MKLLLSGVVAGFALIGAVPEAFATPLVYTYSGIVLSGIDHAGLFGTENLILDELPYSATATFDVDAAQVKHFEPPSFSSVYGDKGTVEISIAGHKVSVSGNYAVVNKPGTHTDITTSPFDAVNYDSAEFDVAANTITFDYSRNGPITVIDPTFSAGRLLHITQDIFGVQTRTQIDFDVESLVISGGVSPVPLPASAPLLAVALLTIGAVGYGIRRKAVAAL